MTTKSEDSSPLLPLSGRRTFTYRSGAKRTFTHVLVHVIPYRTGPEPAWTPATPDGREIYLYPMEPSALPMPDAEAIYAAVGMTPWWRESVLAATTSEDPSL